MIPIRFPRGSAPFTHDYRSSRILGRRHDRPGPRRVPFPPRPSASAPRPPGPAHSEAGFAAAIACPTNGLMVHRSRRHVGCASVVRRWFPLSKMTRAIRRPDRRAASGDSPPGGGEHAGCQPGRRGAEIHDWHPGRAASRPARRARWRGLIPERHSPAATAASLFPATDTSRAMPAPPKSNATVTSPSRAFCAAGVAADILMNLSPRSLRPDRRRSACPGPRRPQCDIFLDPDTTPVVRRIRW